MLDFEQTVVSQYSNSATLLAWIGAINQWIDPRASMDQFYDLVWNVDTAQGWGLDLWGRIVGVDRVLTVTGDKFFGFAEATTVSADPFNQSPFYSGQPTTSNYPLSDTAYRLLILAKAALNITDGSTPAINAILMLLFPGRGDAYVIDNADSTMIYRLEFDLEPFEASIVLNAGVLPRPAGISASVVTGP